MSRFCVSFFWGFFFEGGGWGWVGVTICDFCGGFFEGVGDLDLVGWLYAERRCFLGVFHMYLGLRSRMDLGFSLLKLLFKASS